MLGARTLFVQVEFEHAPFAAVIGRPVSSVPGRFEALGPSPHLDINPGNRGWRRLCAAQLQRVVKIFSDIPPNFCLAIYDKATGPTSTMNDLVVMPR
jgi:hypothetical protein